MSYFHLNCRGLSSNWDSFNNLLCDLHDDTFNFDFIGISEIFNNTGDLRLNLSGYHKLISRCREDGPRGGVGLFIREHINIIIREDISVFIPHVFESVFVEIVHQSARNEIVGVIYRPNTEPLADFDIFESNLSEIMNIINREHKQCVILGDMNIDLLKFETHTKTGHYLDNIFCNGFLPVITKPTRISTSAATLIDHIYINNITSLSRSGILITDVADHFGTFHIIPSQLPNTRNNTIKKRLITANNIEKFKICLNTLDYSNVLESNCPNNAYDIFVKLYTETFNKCFPLGEYKTKSKYIKCDPWHTNKSNQIMYSGNTSFNYTNITYIVRGIINNSIFPRKPI